MTQRLYYTDSYLREFPARVVDRSDAGRVVYLDRTAFYPTSGGQPADTGTIGESEVVDVIDEGARVAHCLAAPLTAGAEVQCRIDWTRRLDHMQQHSGQHVLSATLDTLFELRTVSFHLGVENCTIDLEGGAVDLQRLHQAERRANEIVCENRCMAVSFEDAGAASGLRKESQREGMLRIITIEGFDRSACGGTHVRATGEIGPILLRKTEKIRQNTRVEFVCGSRAVRRARADYDALSRIAQLFSSPLDQAPDLVSAHLEAARTTEKTVRKLELELAGHEGRALYNSTTPGPDGIRRAVHRFSSGALESARALAQSYTASPRAIFVALSENPPSVLLAASEDAGLDAGKALKSALTELGGRGGGNARMAQGSAPDAARLIRFLETLERL